MSINLNNKKEFGDFQTPLNLALSVCKKIKEIGIVADTIIEPTCGVGNFVKAAIEELSANKIYGFELNDFYVKSITDLNSENIKIKKADFFKYNWVEEIKKINGSLLVLGNPPWVTNSVQSKLESKNIPKKINSKKEKGIMAITGSGNFDISESILIESIKWFDNLNGAVAMLVKSSVARKVSEYNRMVKSNITNTKIYKIDANKHFNVNVDACLLIMQFDSNKKKNYDIEVYESLNTSNFKLIRVKEGYSISNVQDYDKYSNMLGESAVKWRSGIKHDASAIMEFRMVNKKLLNGNGEVVDIEMDLVYPLMKGSDIGSNKDWDNKYILITQRKVAEDIEYIKNKYPKTWRYLKNNEDVLNNRKSIIYKNKPKYSIFGVGEYSFKPWKIAICSLYKNLDFRLVGLKDGKPVMFDDTVYFISFDNKDDAIKALEYLKKESVQKLLNSLIFWEDKRAIKTKILNMLKIN